jgi:Sensors of blue-light using FAD
MSSEESGLPLEPDAVELIQCIYTSAGTRPFEPAELTDLLAKARSNNERSGLTGMLLYVDGSFFQVLEGAPDVVDALYVRIEGDPRHVEMTRIIREPIEERSFENWTMGFFHASREDIDRIVGFTGFLRVGHANPDEQADRARKLLSAFRAGSWRKKVLA